MIRSGLSTLKACVGVVLYTVLAFLLLHVALLLLLRHLHGLTPPTTLILDLAKCCFGQCNVGFYVASSSQSAGTPQEQKGRAGGLQLGQLVHFSRRKLSTPQLWPSGHETVNSPLTTSPKDPSWCLQAIVGPVFLTVRPDWRHVSSTRCIRVSADKR